MAEGEFTGVTVRLDAGQGIAPQTFPQPVEMSVEIAASLPYGLTVEAWVVQLAGT